MSPAGLWVSWLRRCALAGKLGLQGPAELCIPQPPPRIGMQLLIVWGFFYSQTGGLSPLASLPAGGAAQITCRGEERLLRSRRGGRSTGRLRIPLFAAGEETPPALSQASGTCRGRPLPPQNHLQIASVCSDKHWKKYIIFFFFSLAAACLLPTALERRLSPQCC